MKRILLIVLSGVILITGCCPLMRQCFWSGPEKPSFLSELQPLENCMIESVDPDSGFTAAFEINIMQPLDHENPEQGTFQQKMILSHRSADKPLVAVLEGYALRTNVCRELSELIDANELRIEHRYFGESVPDSMNWSCLTIEQAAADHHHIISQFKKIYKGPVITTGWSKGGQTVLIHKSLYPEDVSASVVYDAPLNFELEDRRIGQHFESVGTPECRQRLIDFQQNVLMRKEELLPLFSWYSKGKGYAYSIGEEKAFEYIVLEYPFSFWQYTDADCDAIPDYDSDAGEMLEHLRNVVAFSSYSDRAMDSPAMFQFCTQLGYYGYVTKNVENLLSEAAYPNCAFAPQVEGLIYDPVPMEKLNDWLQKNGNEILYLYAEKDPWSAPQVEISSQTNARKYLNSAGNHYTFIRNFSDAAQKEMLTMLQRWINEE